MEHLYALRFTPYPQTSKKDEFVKSRFAHLMEVIEAKDWLYGRETTKNIHYHFVIQFKKEVKSNEIKELIYTVLEVPLDKIGNASFSMVEVREQEKALSYAVKDGDYKCSEGWKEITEDAFRKSKKKPQSLKDFMGDLWSRFEVGELNSRSLWIELIQGRAEMGLPVNLRNIDDMVLSFQIRQNPRLAIDIWEERNTKI